MRSTRIESSSGKLGFTIVELAIVLTIASILIGFAMPRLQEAFQQRTVNGARDSVVLLAAQAKARAMEHAQTVVFTLDTDNGIATVVQAGDTVDIVRFLADTGVAANADPDVITLCYTPRGFATQPCSTALAGPTDVVFARGTYEASVEVWTLGQLRKL